jgi:hypothetical protein
VRALVGVGDPARHLARVHRGVADKAEHRHRVQVARLLLPGFAKSIERPSSRGGVPVFSRPCGSFSSFNRADRLTAGGSPARPAL